MMKILTPAMIGNALLNRFTLKANRGSIGIGLIGVGGWGTTTATNVMRCRRFNIFGVYDKREQTACRFADRFNTKYVETIDELLVNPNIQAIAATVPNQFHEEVVRAVADAGKHIFIEKPLASSPETCRELGKYCQEKGVVLQVGHQMHREPLFCEMKRILEDGDLGKPLYAQAVYTLDRRSRDDWRQDADVCPGGSMEQLGVHLIDVLFYLFGLPLTMHGWAKNIPRRSDEPDWGCVSLSYMHNVRAVLSTSFSSPKYMRLEVFFDGGHLVTDGQTLWIYRSGSNTRKIRPKGLAGGVAQFIEFADCIELGREPETGATRAAAVMDAVHSIYSEKGM